MKVGGLGFNFSNNKCFRNSLILLPFSINHFHNPLACESRRDFKKMEYSVMVSTIAFGAISLGSNPSIPATND